MQESSIARNVTLTSTLNDDLTAYPQQIVIFTCVTIGSGILEWSSNKYIGQGEMWQFTSIRCHGENRTGNDPNTVAICDSATPVDGGQTMIVSQLSIVASVSYPTSTVSCSNNGGGGKMSITFQTTAIGKYVV